MKMKWNILVDYRMNNIECSLILWECLNVAIRNHEQEEKNFNDSSRLNWRAFFLSNLNAMMAKTFKANESAVGGQ
jgi:hypothetical protein